MRNYQYSSRIFNFKNISLLLSIIFLVFSLLRPAWGVKESIVKSIGTDIVFTLDVSKSMKAIDLSVKGEKTDRLTMAKAMIEDFVSKNSQNRYALVIFAGEAFVSTPLTMDHSAFLSFLSGVSYNDITTQGTDLGEALKASIDRFYHEQDKERGKSVVLISDGGEDMTNAIDDFASVAKEIGINIFTIGIGDTKGVPIPESVDFFGRVNYKRHKGEAVLTKLNEGSLKEIAKKTNGEYYHVKKRGDLEKISSKLETLNSTSIQSKEKTTTEDRYQIFLFTSFLFFLIFIFLEINSVTMKDLKKISIKIKSKLKLSFLFLLLFLLTGCSENGLSFRYYNSKGVKSFNNNYFSESQAEFQKASQKSKEGSYISDNNHALASYSLANYQESVEKIQAAIKSQCDNKENDYCDQLYYNLGNALYRLGENSEKDSIKLWQEAIQAYQKDLEINKDDKEAQENIEFIKNKIAQKQEQQKNQQDKNQGEKQNQQNSKQENKSSESQDGQSQEGGEEKNDEQQSRANSKESESEGQKLDQATNQKIENYMKQLEEQSKQNQKYLNQNPEAKNNQDDFFDNSFLQEFFGNNSQGGFNNKNPNEVDW